MQDSAIENAAAGLYDPAMPYHNFNHARYVAGEGRRIVEKCRQENISIDANAVYFAALLHDAGFHLDHARLGFDTKEAYSAHLAGELLRDAGFDDATIDRVRDAILATHYAAHCKTNEAKAVRAADLSGLAADYRVFKINAQKLRKEHALMSGEEIPWRDWIHHVNENVELYLQEDLHLTSDYYDARGKSIFHARARANLERLRGDLEEPA